MATVTKGLWMPLEAKPGKEADVARFLEGGRSLVENEPGTTAWFAVRLGDSQFAIFDAFPDDSGRQAHLSGRVAEALMAQAEGGGTSDVRRGQLAAVLHARVRGREGISRGSFAAW